MKPVRLMVARFPYGRSEDPDVCDWVTTTVLAARDDPRIFEIIRYRIDDTPITMGRNACFAAALRNECDFLLLVDSDMSPDCHLAMNPYCVQPADPAAHPFFESSFEFLWQLRKQGIAGVVGAPYCGPPPHENVYVFRWAKYGNGPESEPDMRLEQFSREEAAGLTGIQEVAALPTGLMLMDCDCMKKIAPPYTYYEWTDDTESGKASTEDVTLTRDLSLNGVPQYCNWDAWAGHWKWKCVSKPTVITSDMIGDKFRKCLEEDIREELTKQFTLELEERERVIREEFAARSDTSGDNGAGGAGAGGGAADESGSVPGSPPGRHSARIANLVGRGR